MKRPALLFTLALLLAGALAYGITQLFLLRFATGEDYPFYSSLRADPLGTKAIYDALDELPALDVQRNYRPIVKVQPAAPVTLFYAGTPHDAWWQAEELRHVEGLALTGSRIVVSFLPVDRPPNAEESRRMAERARERTEKRREKLTGEKKQEQKDAKEKKRQKNTEKGEEPDDDESLSLTSFGEVARRWGFEFKFFPRRDSRAPARRAKLVADDAGLEPELSWHTPLHFDIIQAGHWRTLYSIEGKPVLIERSFGSGSIVLAADSYFLSNEAMRAERAPRVLAWLAGSTRAVIFDEESHGVRESPGIATLVRKYRLHGVAAAMLLIVGLFVWQSCSPFVPPPAARKADAATVVEGRSADEALINLLRRAVPRADLLAVCAAEWKKTFDPEGRTAKAAHVEKVAADARRERDPAAAYRTIAEVLSNKQ
jgi:hypothetical protein